MKETIRLVKILVLLFFNTLVAQTAPEIAWQKSYGGSNSDTFKAIRQTSDNGYILAGSTSSSDFDVTEIYEGSDFWVVKQDSKGTIEWQKTYGGSAKDVAYSIIQTSTGDYIVIGSTGSDDGDVSINKWRGTDNFWIVKLDQSGNMIWDRTFGGTYPDIPYSVIESDDGGYLITGVSISKKGNPNNASPDALGSGDIWVIKLDQNGTLQWNKIYGGSSYEEARSIAKSPDGGYILAGRTTSKDGQISNNLGNMDAWVVKIDEKGNLQWEKTYGGNYQDQATSIQPTPDGGYILTGNTYSFCSPVKNFSNKDAWVVKLTVNGDIEWQKTYGGSEPDSFDASVIMPDHSYILLGNTNSSNGDVTKKHGNNSSGDIWIVKLNNKGDIAWQKTYGGSEHDFSNSLLTNSEGFITFAGTTSSNDGDITKSYNQNPDNFWNTSTDAWIVQLESDLSFASRKRRLQQPVKTTDAVFPNPFSDQITIHSESKIKNVYINDVTGRQWKKTIQINQEKLIIPAQDLPSGIYIISVETTTETNNQKIIKK